jgi:hypothetical protein
MKLMFDAFWRAAAYCLRPKVILLSILPLLISAGLAAGLGYLFWESALAQVRETLDGWAVLSTLLDWLESIGGGGFRNVLAPLLVVALSVPVIVIVSLLLVAALMTPSLVTLVSDRRFPNLERRHGAGLLHSVAWSLLCTVGAMVAMIASIPLWFVPPLVLVLPPLIWGWLTYRVLSFDVMAEHASEAERRQIMKAHRLPLLLMGVITGYLGAAPSLVWAVSAALLIFAPVLIVVAVWIYTLVFAFSALWFAHYTLAALQSLRAGESGSDGAHRADAPELPPSDLTARESALAPWPADRKPAEPPPAAREAPTLPPRP